LTEFCRCKFDERDIRECLGGGCGHKAMIPLRQIISFSLFALNKLLGSDKKQFTTAGKDRYASPGDERSVKQVGLLMTARLTPETW
jgi:hypothetical protein